MRFNFGILLIFCFSLIDRVDASLPDAPKDRPIRIAIDRAPETLNPRRALDAIGQQLGSLIFSSLVHLNENLEPVSDLAESWTQSKNGLEWRFKIRKPFRNDHAGQPITPEKLVQCFQNYRASSEASPIALGLNNWKTTRLDAKTDTIIFALKARDPYFDKNSSLLRYFTVQGTPCIEPRSNSTLVTSGRYEAELKSITFNDRLKLIPVDSKSDSILEFHVLKDEGSRVLALLKGDIDVIQNALSLTKTRYIEKQFASRFMLIERTGVNISYLAINNEDPILKRHRIRQAIAHAINRKLIVEHKMFRFGTIANSLLSPLLNEALVESDPARLRFDLEAARKLLDDEGFHPDPKTGTRLKLHYRSTPVREGIETALMIREMLSKVGIDVQIDVVEPAVFLNSIRKGQFQLYSSRYIGISDASILERAFSSHPPGNRFRYQNAETDKIIEKMMGSAHSIERVNLAKLLQKRLLDELPIVPLWFWNNAALINRDIAIPESFRLSLSGAFEPLARLKAK